MIGPVAPVTSPLYPDEWSDSPWSPLIISDDDGDAGMKPDAARTTRSVPGAVWGLAPFWFWLADLHLIDRVYERRRPILHVVHDPAMRGNKLQEMDDFGSCGHKASTKDLIGRCRHSKGLVQRSEGSGKHEGQ